MPKDRGKALLVDIADGVLHAVLTTPGEPFGDHASSPCDSLPELEAGLDALLAGAGRPPLVGVAVSAAGPVIEGQIKLTNSGWAITLKGLKSQLGVHRAHLVNDCVASAMAMPRLSPDLMIPVKPGEEAPAAAMVTIAPGQGLGVAALLPQPGGGWTAAPSEGGHIDLAPSGQREGAVLDVLRGTFGHVSYERVLCRPGLATLYRALEAVDGVAGADAISPSAVIARARDGEARALETFALFSSWLGAFAANVALMCGARGGVFLACPLLSDLEDLFDAAAFTRRFTDKGRLSAYLATVPVHLVRDRVALTGLSSLFSANDQLFSAVDVHILDC